MSKSRPPLSENFVKEPPELQTYISMMFGTYDLWPDYLKNALQQRILAQELQDISEKRKAFADLMAIEYLQFLKLSFDRITLHLLDFQEKMEIIRQMKPKARKIVMRVNHMKAKRNRPKNQHYFNFKNVDK